MQLKMYAIKIYSSNVNLQDVCNSFLCVQNMESADGDKQHIYVNQLFP